MKSFFKYTLATIVGIFLASILMFFFSMLIINSIVAMQEKPTELKPNSVLSLELRNEILDRTVEDPIANFDPITFETEKKIGLNSLLENIDKAADNAMIDGIYLNLSDIQAPWATVQEIRNALADFKLSGKFVYAYSEYLTQKAYYLASVADEVYMNPEGMLEWTGLRSEVLYFKNALDKLGIDATVVRHGKFKSAAEPFVSDNMSVENEEQIELFLNSLWENILTSIAENRALESSKLDALAGDLSIVKDINNAVEEGLIDGVKYYDEVLADLKELTGSKDVKSIRKVTYAAMQKVPKNREFKGLAKEKIAVVYAQGNIVPGEAQEGFIGSERISKAIREARLDSTIKAIVFRINSGGGSALASEVIWRELKLASEEKPVIASMGDYAASGGYYAITHADKIIASPNTITGSIGVFALLPNGRELMNEKLGINVEVVRTNPSADFASIFRPLSRSEQEAVKHQIESIYSTFINHVAEGRELTMEYVDSIAQGRVWDAVHAKELGLVDELGGLERAIELAVEASGLEQYRIVDLPKLEDPFELLIKRLSGEVKTRQLKNHLGTLYPYIEQLKLLTESQNVQARMPFVMDIY
ncbi:MAG: signal peptide peptidase SppA [Bacteroidota bacterium]